MEFNSGFKGLKTLYGSIQNLNYLRVKWLYNNFSGREESKYK